MGKYLGRRDAGLISVMVERFGEIQVKVGGSVDLLELAVAVSMVHLNACPLKLAELTTCPIPDFMHDLCGIHRTVDRATGQFREDFTPRLAQDGSYEVPRKKGIHKGKKPPLAFT